MKRFWHFLFPPMLVASVRSSGNVVIQNTAIASSNVVQSGGGKTACKCPYCGATFDTEEPTKEGS